MFGFLNGYKTIIGGCILAVAHTLEKAGKLPAGLVDTVMTLGGTILTIIGAAHKVDKLTAAVSKPATGGGGTGQ